MLALKLLTVCVVQMNDERINKFSLQLHIPFLFQAAIPFSVIGSNTIVEVNGKKIRGRLYPWGIVDGTPFIPMYFFFVTP